MYHIQKGSIYGPYVMSDQLFKNMLRNICFWRECFAPFHASHGCCNYIALPPWTGSTQARGFRDWTLCDCCYIGSWQTGTLFDLPVIRGASMLSWDKLRSMSNNATREKLGNERSEPMCSSRGLQVTRDQAVNISLWSDSCGTHLRYQVWLS